MTREGEGRGGERRGEEGVNTPDCTVPCPSSRNMIEKHLFQCVGCGADETLASDLCSSEKLNVS